MGTPNSTMLVRDSNCQMGQASPNCTILCAQFGSAYAMSHLTALLVSMATLQVMFAYSLQRRVKDHKITVSCLHPGAVSEGVWGREREGREERVKTMW